MKENATIRDARDTTLDPTADTHAHSRVGKRHVTASGHRGPLRAASFREIFAIDVPMALTFWSRAPTSSLMPSMRRSPDCAAATMNFSLRRVPAWTAASSFSSRRALDATWAWALGFFNLVIDDGREQDLPDMFYELGRAPVPEPEEEEGEDPNEGYP